MLHDSVVVVVVRTRPRVIPLAMITMRKSTHGFPFVYHIWDAYGPPLGVGPPEFRYQSVSMRNFYRAKATANIKTRSFKSS